MRDQRYSVKRQRGMALLAVIMVVLVLVSMGFMSFTMGKKDMQVGYAYAEQAKAFEAADAMFQRVRFVIKQLIDSPQVSNRPDNVNSVVWYTSGVASAFNPDVVSDAIPAFNDYRFVQRVFADDSRATTCAQLQSWAGKFSNIDISCDDIGDDARIIIEHMTTLNNAEFFRVTVYGHGYESGYNIVQGNVTKELK